jgi:signal transduction histidine kinase
MLSALIRNAIDANARKVTVDVRKVCEKDPTVGEKRFVEFLVRDDGHGIPIEYRSQIGKPGWTSKGKRGHGIGLTIVDLLSRDMGGRLVLLSGGKSVGEKETVFSLRLPGHHH